MRNATDQKRHRMPRTPVRAARLTSRRLERTVRDRRLCLLLKKGRNSGTSGNNRFFGIWGLKRTQYSNNLKALTFETAPTFDVERAPTKG